MKGLDSLWETFQLFNVWGDIANFVVVWEGKCSFPYIFYVVLPLLFNFFSGCNPKHIKLFFLAHKWSLQDESKLYIFLELVTKGSLSSLYNKYRLRDSQVSAYTRQILNGLMYLHGRNVVHRWYTWYYYQVFGFSSYLIIKFVVLIFLNLVKH